MKVLCKALVEIWNQEEDEVEDLQSVNEEGRIPIASGSSGEESVPMLDSVYFKQTVARAVDSQVKTVGHIFGT